MATYKELEQDSYYLIREQEGGEITLVQPIMETAKCLLLTHIDEIELNTWKKKDDAVYEIIEQLTIDQVLQYQQLFEDEDDDYLNWQEEEEGYSFEDEEEEALGEEEEGDERKR